MASTRKGRKGPASAGPLRVLGYARVSTDEQASSGAGMAAQRSAIKEACTGRGYELAQIVEDAGFSAKNLDRPGIAGALEDLDAGRAEVLLVAKLDRLSRSLLDFAALMERARRKGWAIVALDLGVDTTTPAGEMMANVLATFSQFERRLIGERTKSALAQKKAAGVVLGRRSTLPPSVADRIMAERASGRTLQAIADGLNADQVPTGQGAASWRPSSVRAVLAGRAR